MRMQALVLILLMCTPLVPGRLAAQKSAAMTTAEPEEYLVYAVILDSLQKSGKAPHPLVANRTSIFACDSSACNGFHMAGCNGLLGPDETPESRMEVVKRDLPKLDAVAATRFIEMNQKCSIVRDQIPAASKYYLFSPKEGPKLPPDWQHPDFVYVSRVAFDANLSQALVYAGVMSGTDERKSTGAYYFLRKQRGKWSIQGSSAAWALKTP